MRFLNEMNECQGYWSVGNHEKNVEIELNRLVHIQKIHSDYSP